MTTPDINLDALEAAALDATPGPWKAVDTPGAGLEIYADVPLQLGMQSRQWPAFSTANADIKKDLVAYETWVQFPSEKLNNIQAKNAIHIATANPAVVLELIRRLRAAEGATK